MSAGALWWGTLSVVAWWALFVWSAFGETGVMWGAAPFLLALTAIWLKAILLWKRERKRKMRIS